MKRVLVLTGAGVGGFILFAMVALWADVEVTQWGYRGVGMENLTSMSERAVAERTAASEVPEMWPPEPVGEQPELARDVYENVPLLGHLTVDNFNRLMAEVTTWVSPEEGCNYCHLDEPLASDKPWQKRLSRSMFEMVWAINEDWGQHVAPSGVTCWTCHRGQPIPTGLWFADATPDPGNMGWNAGQNKPKAEVAYASLPYDIFTPFLLEAQNIRVVPTTALPIAGRDGEPMTKATEKTYGLMMHLSDALGVNCTYCHNTRTFYDWSASPPQRVTAWYGIQLARVLNNDHLVPLADLYPESRLGPMGDPPKLNCTTCHKGQFKPMAGQNMIDNYPSLAARPQGTEPAPTGEAAPAEEPAAAEEEAAPAEEPAAAEEEAAPAEEPAAAEEEAAPAEEPAAAEEEAAPAEEPAAAEEAAPAEEPAATEETAPADEPAPEQPAEEQQAIVLE